MVTKKKKGSPSKKRKSAPSVDDAFLCEVAWEVCNQLGGIYTVLRSKAPAMVEMWGDRYLMIGPYVPERAAVEFEELMPEGPIALTMDALTRDGVTCRYGRWLVPGHPRTILIEPKMREAELERRKFLLWKELDVETHVRDAMVDEVVAFGCQVADFLDRFAEVSKKTPLIAHFHEWMGGVAVPLIRKHGIPVATIFTTHGTLLGRYMSSASEDFYGLLDKVNPVKEARQLGIPSRYALERLAVQEADVFTTVSDLSAGEALKLLGRKSDFIVPNGLSISQFEAPDEFQALHRIYKARIHDFVTGHFFGSYTFDLDTTVYLFTAGRYEYRNKGKDIFIESLATLNRRLIEDDMDLTVVGFIVANADVRSINVDVLSQHALYHELRQVCGSVEHDMGTRLFQRVVEGRIPDSKDVFTETQALRIRRSMLAWQSKKLPRNVTHDLTDPDGDPVIQKLRACGLLNAEKDRVKVVFHPQFVASTSPILGLDYQQFVRGCNLGVFPSYYEPWGYTPMECVALGIPAVASDLSGFGNHLVKILPDYEANGLCVINRHGRTAKQTVESLTDFLYDFCRLNRRQRRELRNRVERVSHLFDWSEVIGHYRAAYSAALKGR